MKNIILILVLFLSIKAFSQNFEGTIKWAIKVEVTDPKQKAQLEQAQKQMNDPATQAQMKQMMEKMNDPQFKAMMDSNPQLKAQIEKMVQNGFPTDVSSMFPKELIVKVKNKNALTKIEGGILASEILYVGDKDKTYNLNREKKTYSVLTPPDKNDSKTDADVKITKTSETIKILNYTCTKYIAEVTSGTTKITQYLWATKEIKDFDMKALAKQHIAKNGQRMFYEEIDGVPLKMEMSLQGNIMTMEVKEIKRESLPAADFTVPADFKEIK